jgi:hypothetical protein
MSTTAQPVASLVDASKQNADALFDEKGESYMLEKSHGPLYTTTLSPAERELEKKLKRKIDMRWLVLTLIYILNCKLPCTRTDREELLNGCYFRHRQKCHAGC